MEIWAILDPQGISNTRLLSPLWTLFITILLQALIKISNSVQDCLTPIHPLYIVTSPIATFKRCLHTSTCSMQTSLFPSCDTIHRSLQRKYPELILSKQWLQWASILLTSPPQTKSQSWEAGRVTELETRRVNPQSILESYSCGSDIASSDPISHPSWSLSNCGPSEFTHCNLPTPHHSSLFIKYAFISFF
jgi:hypothetical protein